MQSLHRLAGCATERLAFLLKPETFYASSSASRISVDMRVNLKIRTRVCVFMEKEEEGKGNMYRMKKERESWTKGIQVFQRQIFPESFSSSNNVSFLSHPILSSRFCLLMNDFQQWFSCVLLLRMDIKENGLRIFVDIDEQRNERSRDWLVDVARLKMIFCKPIVSITQQFFHD